MAASERRAGLLQAVLAVCWAAATVAVLRVLLWTGPVPEPAAVDPDDYFDPARVAADGSYRDGLWAALVVLTLLGPAVAIAIAATRRRWSERLAARIGLTEDAGRTRVALGGATVGGAIALVSALVALPVRVWRHDWVRDHDVGRQPVASFLGDLGQEALVQAVILGAVGAAVAVALARVRAWWVALGAGAALVAVVTTMAAPLVIQPLFERTTSLADGALAAEIRDLADRAGVDVGEVAVSDASARSRIVNARVEGLFGTQRVVLDDTLTGTPREQVRWVVAHELVHVERRHVLKGLAWAVALVFPLALLVGGVARLAAREGDDVLGRVAVVFAATSVVLVLVTPVERWVSRALESEADWRALALTVDPDAAIAHRVLARDLARAEPDPPRLLHLWFGTHPTPVERVGLAERARGVLRGQTP